MEDHVDDACVDSSPAVAAAAHQQLLQARLHGVREILGAALAADPAAEKQLHGWRQAMLRLVAAAAPWAAGTGQSMLEQLQTNLVSVADR